MIKAELKPGVLVALLAVFIEQVKQNCGL